MERDGERWILNIEKEPYEEMGIDFVTDLFDGLKKCHNKCIFCFVDQTPPGMRHQVYVKDDDYRLSFLYGNFITLNNTAEVDLKRIIDLRLSPLYISVHTLNSSVRKLLFGIKSEDNIYEKLRFLVKRNIELHTQIVLCNGINDGKELDETIEKLSKLYPCVRSIGVVPVGLTRYRKGLYPLIPYNSISAYRVIKQVEEWQKRFRKTIKTNLVFLADEFYILSGRKFPSFRHYEGFYQLENGIGMAANFLSPLLRKKVKFHFNRKITIVTGKASLEILEQLKNYIYGSELQILQCPSFFWGDSITVTGLLTGEDIYRTLKNIDTEEDIFIPENSLRKDGFFLDDMSVECLGKRLGKNIHSFSGSALDFLKFMEENKYAKPCCSNCRTS
ncbi:MAG: hypothetical protein BWY64_03858 [bacterium ADurb.Bin363]|nr:MAG: hypothetical protein BWY64_03858 [bacterium ADurb.Bin363]